ncbi:MAG TPA: hypothetical protein VN842_00115, partial [Thermoplasmata archaeon]|nr:hypothetical protein [Thermoplasmata archaeon]
MPAAIPTSPLVSPSLGGSCSAGARGGGTPAASPSAGPRPSGTTGPSPLFNSQVVPYAVLTGPYGYVAAGAALRDQGFGLINLTWPGGSTSNLVAA